MVKTNEIGHRGVYVHRMKFPRLLSQTGQDGKELDTGLHRPMNPPTSNCILDRRFCRNSDTNFGSCDGKRKKIPQ